jgi:hypothetical protein
VSRILRSSFAARLAAAALLSIASPSGAAAHHLQEAVAGPSDQASARADLAKAPAEGRIERQDIEVVESVGRNIPNPLTPQRVESFVTESVTTSKAGRLLVTKSMDLTTTCTPASGVIYFLLVDDLPVRNSAVFSRTGLAGQVSGVTTDVVEAGTHTIKVGLTCTVPGAYPSGATVAVIGITSVVVLP